MVTALRQNVQKGDPNACRGASTTVRRSEWIVGAVMALVVIHLHWVYLIHAGGLWRDEAGFVGLVTLPSWGDVWKMLPHDHCPILLPALVRLWSKTGLGQTDFGLRTLGFCLGLLLPVCFWVASGIMRRGVPLLPLALVALNVTVIRVGDSFRGYGLGSALGVLTLALVWRVAEKPTVINTVLAALTAVLGVQCLYQNAFFVLAACSAGIVVCATRRGWTHALWILGVGLAAAASLVPYVRVILRSQEWYILEKTGFRFTAGWENASSAMGFPLPEYSWLWVALCLASIWIARPFVLPRVRSASNMAHRDLVLFGAVALVVCLASFAVFLKVAGLPTQSWYYTPLMAFVIVCLDAVLTAFGRWVRPALILFASLTAILAYPMGLPAVKCRQTNMDLLADVLAKEATSNDLIIVHPWYCGVSFARYYKGAAPWTTLPQLEDHRLHRYDLLKIKMQMDHPIQPILDKVTLTLQSSNRVWLVGWIPLDGKPPPDMRPAPNNPWGWFDEPYSHIWGATMGCFIAAHANQGTVFMPPSTNCVNPFENLPVFLTVGWR